MQGYLDAFANSSVAVIGDVMLDCYMSGSVSRISPEAPVPVMRVATERSVPGGAANVAANLARLNVGVEIVGLAGQDAARDELIACLREIGDINCAGILAVHGRRTTRKLRIIGEHQQIVRVDHEDAVPCDDAVAERFLRVAITAIDATDVVVLSDYGKGVCSHAVMRGIFHHAAAAGKRVIVDPKRSDLSAYRGASVLTPNRKELSEAVGMPCETDEEAAAAAARASEISGADILLTRSEKGMSFFPQNGEPIHLATVAQDVFDVSGAGDTVVAVLAASMAVNAPFLEGMRMANYAAGIVVSKLGTATVTQEELARSLYVDQGTVEHPDGALLSWNEAIARRQIWERERLTVGFANGCFDLLHPGHVALIRQAAESCDRLIMALNTDASVRRLKGPSRPIQNEAARAEVMGAIRGVATVVLFDQDTPRELIEALQPDVLIKGADYTIDKVVGADIVQARDGRVVLVDLSVGHSTSRLVAASAERRELRHPA